MSASAAALATISSDHWNADVYGSLSVAFQIAALVKHRAQVIRVAFIVRRFSNSVGDSIDLLHAVMQGKAVPPSDSSSEPMTPERGQNAVRMLRDLSNAMDEIYDKAKWHGLTNYSLVAGSFLKLQGQAERILEIADWLELILEPESIESLFDRARAEQEQGEVYNLSQVE